MSTSAVHTARDIQLVSFIIPAWNEEVLIGRTVQTVRTAGETLDTAYEIVVADDASTDATAERASRSGARVVSVSHRQISATRNAGARAAKGDVLIFVDADTLVTPEVVRAAVMAIRRGAVGGGCTVQFDSHIPRYARLLVPVFIRLYRAAKLAAGCFLFCTREAFETVGGFSEKVFASEECWLSWALRKQGQFVILREQVLTSSRKLRTFSSWEMLKGIFWLTLGGLPTARDRKGMDFWYGPRRADPGAGPEQSSN